MTRIPTICMAFAVSTLMADAQITVTNSVFPTQGDTLHYAFGNQPNAIDVVNTPPGGDQMWDLSALQEESTWDAIYRDSFTGVGAAYFPGAELRYTPVDGAPGQEDYLDVTNTQVQFMGSFGADPLQLGYSVPVRWEPPIVEQRAPLNFFDVHAQASNGLTQYYSFLMPADWITQFPTSDLFRSVIHVNMTTVVDGFGTMAIPGGSYAVLREKRIRTTETRLLVLFLGETEWVDVTDVAIDQLGMGAVLGIQDTTITYHFVNDVSKETIAVCELTNAENEVLGVRYKVADLSTGTGSMANTDASVRVFPNPAADRIQVQAPGLRSAAAEILVVDAMGRAVMRRVVAPGSAGLGLELDISGLEAGLYRGCMVPERGAPLEFRFIKR